MVRRAVYRAVCNSINAWRNASFASLGGPKGAKHQGDKGETFWQIRARCTAPLSDRLQICKAITGRDPKGILTAAST